MRPIDRDLLNVTLPAVDDPSLDTLIDERVVALVRQMDASAQYAPHAPSSALGNGGNGRGQLSILFYEKRRKKSYFAFGKADEEVCWEQWDLDVTMARPKNEVEASKVQEAMETSLQNAAIKIVSIASLEKNHIPPITTSETNPFPYQIIVNPKEQGWSKSGGLF